MKEESQGVGARGGLCMMRWTKRAKRAHLETVSLLKSLNKSGWSRVSSPRDDWNCVRAVWCLGQTSKA